LARSAGVALSFGCSHRFSPTTCACRSGHIEAPRFGRILGRCPFVGLSPPFLSAGVLRRLNFPGGSTIWPHEVGSTPDDMAKSKRFDLARSSGVRVCVCGVALFGVRAPHLTIWPDRGASGWPDRRVLAGLEPPGSMGLSRRYLTLLFRLARSPVVIFTLGRPDDMASSGRFDLARSSGVVLSLGCPNRRSGQIGANRFGRIVGCSPLAGLPLLPLQSSTPWRFNSWMARRSGQIGARSRGSIGAAKVKRVGGFRPANTRRVRRF